MSPEEAQGKFSNTSIEFQKDQSLAKLPLNPPTNTIILIKAIAAVIPRNLCFHHFGLPSPKPGAQTLIRL